MTVVNNYTFAKARLIFEYPPPYKRHVYAKADVNGINKAIS